MNDTDRTLHRYVEELTMRLRMRNLPPERIGQVVAEVEAHVADTGEAPADVFGTVDESTNPITRASSVSQRADWRTPAGAC